MPGIGVRNNGMTSSAAALRYYERRQAVAANNLANVSTDGFKKERVFARMIGDALPAVDAVTDRTAGTLRPTGAPLDLALGGDGFFVVSTPQGERLSRGGSFRLDEGGRLVDANGNTLLSTQGPIVLPHGDEVSITEHGVVRAGGAEVARLRLESVPAGARIQHAGGNLFIPDAAARAPLAEGSRLVRQGYLEDSNVDTVGSMVDMIEIQRAYAAVQKAMTTLDEIRGTAANEIGRPV